MADQGSILPKEPKDYRNVIDSWPEHYVKRTDKLFLNAQYKN